MLPTWMNEAWAELGQAEVDGAGSNPRIFQLYRDAGFSEIDNDETAWCAAFVGACLERAQLRGSRSLRARSYLDWGEALDKPRLGAIAIYSRGPNPKAGHVGFWVGETGTHDLILGGNQNDAVTVAAISKKRTLGYRFSQARAAKEEGLNFERAFQHILDVEGGYTDDAYDPGGPTNKGITLRTLASHLGIEVNAQTTADLKNRIKAISDDLAREIYRERYWIPSKAGALAPAIALMHFDAAVNQGVGRAIRFLQEAAGTDVDGEIGPLTRAAVAKAEPASLLKTYANLRRRHYRGLKHFWRFGRGWLNRVDITVSRAGAFLPSKPIEHRKTGDHSMPEKAQSAEQDLTKWWGESVTLWGTFITTLATVLPVVGPLFGLNLTAELINQFGQDVVNIGQAVGGMLGTLMIIYGRARATTRLTSRQISFKL